MSEKSLVRYFQSNPILTTDVGDFEFYKNIGQGGNARVLEFRKGDQAFAIKFISHEDSGKVRRFKDEFFCSVQIPTHKNIVHSYHFDEKELDGTLYSLIVMKRYERTLHEVGSISNQSTEVKTEKVQHLVTDLMTGLKHLHNNKIIHRDIKPQNIFFDTALDMYVIGDLGIAHFSPEVFAKEAQTKSTERLANYLFSAPEQADSKKPAVQASDIYALGQVIQWFLTGSTIRGLGRPKFTDNKADRALSLLDAIVDISLRNNPSERFQSIEEIELHIKNSKKSEKPDPWIEIHKFDDAIRRSFPKIRSLLETSDQNQIGKFVNNFHKLCGKNEYWWVNVEGGDNTLNGLERLNDGSWLLNGTDEIEISKLIIYRDSGYPYKNFFILLTAPMKPFEYVDYEGRPIVRATGFQEYRDDIAVLFEGRYIDPAETDNGYYACGDETLEVNLEDFKHRRRYLKPYAFLVVIQGSASAHMTDRQPNQNLLTAALANSTLSETALKEYLDSTRAHHSSEITMWN